MKRILYIGVCLGLFAMTFSSCSSDDGYELDKRIVGFGTIEANGNELGFPYDIRLDNGSLLVIRSTRIGNFEVVDQERVIVNFSIIGERANDNEGNRSYEVLLNNLYRVLYKDPVKMSSFEEDEELEEKIGNDPIRIDEIWVGGKYLNIEFAVPFRANSSVKHFINLVYDDYGVNDEGEIELYLRHNGYTDVPAPGATDFRYGKGLVSFDLSSLVPDGETSIKIKLNWTQFTGTGWSATANKTDSRTFKPYSKSNPTPDDKTDSANSSFE